MVLFLPNETHTFVSGTFGVVVDVYGNNAILATGTYIDIYDQSMSIFF
jgi:hypothetical protein